MTYLFEALQKPTRLYIKQCPHCGLKYFGKTVCEDIENYSGSGTVWRRHLKKHKVTPTHLWASDWYYDTSIIRFATKFSNLNKIVQSGNWANLVIENGIDGGYLGEEASKKAARKIRQTRNDPEWKSTTGKVASVKQSLTKNSPEWKFTVGKKSTNKIIETKNSPEWKATTGKDMANKLSRTQNDLMWKETTGKEKSVKLSQIQNDPEWKETVGKERANKISLIRNDPKWKEQNSKMCEHCRKKISVAGYAQWHGNKCKENK